MTISKAAPAPRSLRRWLATFTALAAVGFAATPAHAVPAFARQTGQDCIACHVGGFGPQLTPFGRAFKLGGYTLSNGKSHLPLSAMLVSSYTHTTDDNTAPPTGFHANDNLAALQQASIFLAGRITDHVGVMGQATYSDPGSQNLAWDNTDLRYAHDYRFGSTSGVFGVSVNNNPTVSDVWNTVPAWQFGFMSTPFGGGYGPASPMIASLGQSVIGTTAYTLVNNHWYFEGGLYHGISNWWANQLHATGDAVDGLNPYWRVNYTNYIGNSNYEVGLIGMNTKVEDGINAGSNNTFKDVGLDASYQFINGGVDSVTVNGLYMHERQNYTAAYIGAGSASNASDTLNFFNLNTAYWYQNTYGATIQFFGSTGSADPMLAAANKWAGNDPQTSGVVWELDWNPFGKSWVDPEKNLRLGLQYTTYNKYGGSSSGASGNNSLFVYLWTAI